jgi:hypothetical protein
MQVRIKPTPDRIKQNNNLTYWLKIVSDLHRWKTIDYPHHLGDNQEGDNGGQ